MTSVIAVALSGLIALASLARALWLGGRRDGKLDEILQRLTDGLGDHETRLRTLEHAPRRR